MRNTLTYINFRVKIFMYSMFLKFNSAIILFYWCYVHRFFKLYKPWKVFSVWKKGLKRGKMLAAGAALTKNLFLFNPPLRNALFLVRQLSVPVLSLGMLSLPDKETFDIQDFITAQSEGM